jgi:S-adenosyl-L-methionine hydrolase (adenosine-forming)
MAIITLTTDFGRGDYGVAMMRGVIWSIAPNTEIVDLSHEISPQNVPQAAELLSRCSLSFPPGTIHIAVVDPGVGTARRPVAARLGAHFYVGPDNGLFSKVWELATLRGETSEIVHLEQSQYWLPRVSDIFHGRDIFAPVAAHLARGVALSELGDRLQRLNSLD